MSSSFVFAGDSIMQWGCGDTGVEDVDLWLDPGAAPLDGACAPTRHPGLRTANDLRTVPTAQTGDAAEAVTGESVATTS